MRACRITYLQYFYSKIIVRLIFFKLIVALYLSSRHFAFINEKPHSVNAEMAGTLSRFKTILIKILNSFGVFTNIVLFFRSSDTFS